MAIALELPTRLAGILNSYEPPVIVIGKLREINVVEVADFVGLAAHAQDLGDFPQLLKLGELTLALTRRLKPLASHDAALQIKMVVRTLVGRKVGYVTIRCVASYQAIRIWIECKQATLPPKAASFIAK